MSFLALLPLLIQGTTALTPLIAALSQTLAAVVPAVVSAAAGTSAGKALVTPPPPSAILPSVANPVVFLQEMLVAAGHSIEVDGMIGPQTMNAVDAFAETALGIVPGGLLSLVLREALAKL